MIAHRIHAFPLSTALVHRRAITLRAYNQTQIKGDGVLAQGSALRSSPGRYVWVGEGTGAACGRVTCQAGLAASTRPFSGSKEGNDQSYSRDVQNSCHNQNNP